MSEALPDHWGTTSIENSAYLRGRIGWQGLRADEFIEDGPYLVTGTDFKDGKIDWSTCYHVTEARYREAAPIQLRDDDLLVTKDGTIGKIAHVSDCPDQAVLNSGVFLLRCSNGSFRHRWLYHLLTSSHFEKFLRQNLAGSTINHLYQYVFDKYEFPVPQSDEEQKKLCKIIDLIDTQIEATEALIAKQERLRAGLMQDLFTRGVDENGELRPPRKEAPHLYHETELGWLPESWQVKSLAGELRHSMLGTAIRGNAGAANSVPLIKMGNLRWGEMELSEVELLDRRFADREPRHWLEYGDLLFNTRNTPELVGKSAVYHAEFSEAVFDNNILRMRFSEIVKPDLLCAYMNHGLGKQQVNTLATGTTSVAAVYWSALQRYRFPHPSSKDEGRTLVEILLHSKKQIDDLRYQLGKLQRQKAGLMQDLLTGTVSVEPLLEKEPA